MEEASCLFLYFKAHSHKKIINQHRSLLAKLDRQESLPPLSMKLMNTFYSTHKFAPEKRMNATEEAVIS